MFKFRHNLDITCLFAEENTHTTQKLEKNKSILSLVKILLVLQTENKDISFITSE